MNNNKDGAVGFDYPNDIKPTPYNQIRHAHLHVPTPTNSGAKKVPAAEVMRAVREAK